MFFLFIDDFSSVERTKCYDCLYIAKSVNRCIKKNHNYIFSGMINKNKWFFLYCYHSWMSSLVAKREQVDFNKFSIL
jgi:hypothetical protein